MALTSDQVIEKITEVLKGADGEYLAEIYNRICPDEVQYEGDSLFSQYGDQPKQANKPQGTSFGM